MRTRLGSGRRIGSIVSTPFDGLGRIVSEDYDHYQVECLSTGQIRNYAHWGVSDPDLSVPTVPVVPAVPVVPEYPSTVAPKLYLVPGGRK